MLKIPDLLKFLIPPMLALYATPTPQYSLKATAATSPAHLHRNPFLCGFEFRKKKKMKVHRLREITYRYILSRIHEHTIPLRHLAIILRVLYGFLKPQGRGYSFLFLSCLLYSVQ
jgi:hypothetical protein